MFVRARMQITPQFKGYGIGKKNGRHFLIVFNKKDRPVLAREYSDRHLVSSTAITLPAKDLAKRSLPSALLSLKALKVTSHKKNFSHKLKLLKDNSNKKGHH